MPERADPSPNPSPEMLPDRQTFLHSVRRGTFALALAIGVPAVLLLALVLYLMHSAARVDESARVIAETRAVQTLLLDMETGVRGYQVTSDERFLDPYAAAKADIQNELANLSKLVEEDAAERAEAKGLENAIAVWMAFAGEAVSRERSKTNEADAPVAAEVAFNLRGKELMDAARARLTQITATERGRHDRLAATRGALRMGLLIALAGSAFLGAPAVAGRMRRALHKTAATYEQSLAATTRRATELAVTLRSIGDAVMATDARGAVAFLNPVAERLTGWTTAEALGRPLGEVFDIFNEATGEPAENPVERVLREKRVAGLANHTVLRARDGSETPIEDSAAPILDDAGAVRGVIMVFHDVGEKRWAGLRLAASEERLRFLNELGEAMRPLTGAAEIMDVVTRRLGQHLRASRCVYAEVAEDGERVRIQRDFCDGCASVAGDRALSDFGPQTVSAMREGRTLVLRAPVADAGAAALAFEGIEAPAMICRPLLKDGALRAILAVHQTAPREWTAGEIALVEDVAERSWAGIERARAEAEVRERAELLNLRVAVANQLSTAEPLGDSLQRCCELLVEHLDAAFARVWLLESETQVLELRASAGIYTHLDGAHARVPAGEFKIGRIAASGRAHLTNDVAHDPNISDPEWARREGMRAFAGYPLLVEGRTVGVLALFARHALSPATLEDLAPVADAVAQWIERKRARAALEASEAVKGTILDTAIDGFILMDHEGRIIDWNAASAEIFGVPREEALGRSLGETIVPERLRAAHREGLARYVATREAHIVGRRHELPAVRADGTEFVCEVSINPLPGIEPPLFAGYVRDISERKQAEEDLRTATSRAESSALLVAESAERFRILAEVVDLQVWTATPGGLLDFANQECVKYFGADLDRDILGDRWAQFVHPEDLEEALGMWRTSVENGAPYQTEFRLRDGAGEYRWFLTRAQAMTGPEGGVVMWFGTNTDIHDLKLAQEEAERANRTKDNFLAALSHELRMPLTPVLMSAASLREDERLPQDVRDQLAMMERNIALEARLIDDLLDLTRIARGKLLLRPQPCDAHSLIGLAVEIIRDEAQAKGMTIERDFSAENSGLEVDPARFQQVIWNLLRNAVKFTPRGGRVFVRTRDCQGDDGGQRLHIEVADTGIGISESQLEKIFLPFEQGGLTGDHRFGGVGLGLAITRAIVDLHGGTIEARSEGENHGATFIVELPEATAPPHGLADGSGAPVHPLLPGFQHDGSGRPPRQPLRLLLVEDHEPTLQVLSRLLSRAGHEIVAAGNITDALARADEHSFDLVISDLGLPDGTGAEMMAKMRDRHGLRGIALSGYGMDEDIARSREAGFVAHLIKPIDFPQLERALRTAIAEEQQQQPDPAGDLTGLPRMRKSGP